jgi:ribosomal protein L29
MKVLRVMVIGVIAFVPLRLNPVETCLAEEKASLAENFKIGQMVELAAAARLPAIQKELQLSADQIGKVGLIENLMKERFEKYAQGWDQPHEESRVCYLNLVEEMHQIWSLTSTALSAGQIERLKQLARQHATRDPRCAFSLIAPELKKELVITDDQAKALREKSAAMAERLNAREAELKLELEKLRVKMRAELVHSLDPTQREVVKRLWGELVPIPQ